MQSLQVSTPGGDDFIASFSFQRQRLLAHAGSLLTSSAAEVAADEAAVSKLAQTLVSSLEFLKVAEMEVADERRRHATVEAAQSRQIAHFRAMFELAPTPLLLTTADTTIRDVNSAAARLLGFETFHLEGRQLSSMVPRAQLSAFKEQLGHMLALGHVAAWSFTLDVHRNPSVVVSATVDTIDDPAVGARALYWNIRTV